MPSPESPLIEMAAKPKPGKPEKPSAEKKEKTQAELRESLERRFGALKSGARDAIDEYEKGLEDGAFEDKDGEETGTGDKRKELAQAKIGHMLTRAEEMKETLDSKEDLPQSAPQIEATYTYIDRTTGKVDSPETITLDLEQKTREFLDFYAKTAIDLPPDFAETIQDIWERNNAEIQEAVEQNGFDEILIVPPGLSLPDLHPKMTKGYSKTWEGDNFKQGGSFTGAQSQNTDKPRIILVHKTQNLKDRPELAQTLNIKGQDVNLDQTLTLEDYLVFQRKYFEETGKHLDEDGWTWLATKSGARLVRSAWYPGDGKLYVDAFDLGFQSGPLGARPSRSFF